MDALAALALQIAWGADEALADAPRDRLRQPAALAVLAPAPVGPSVTIGAVARGQALAAAALTPETLREALAGFDGCALRATATSLVFGAGNPASGVVLVADVPGTAEDRAGVPFAGPAAAFLERMLGSIGLTLDGVFATSLLPWRPPGDRKPAETEVQLCLPFLLRHLTLLRPRFVLLTGSLTTRTLLPGVAGRRARGWQRLAIGEDMIPALSFGTPLHIQATPSARREAWANLVRLRRALDGSPIGDRA